MPKGKYPKKRRFKSSKRRLGTGRLRKQNINHVSKTPFLGLQKTAVLPYYKLTNITTGAANIATHVFFTANGAFQPDLAGIHQPMGFDQAMLFYNHYTVTASKISINAYLDPTVNTVPVMLCLGIAPDTAAVGAITDPARLIENGQIKRKVIMPGELTNSKSQSTIGMSCNIASQNGRSMKDIVGDYLFRGDAASNPVEQTYFDIFAYQVEGAPTPKLIMEVLIEYVITFTEPKKDISS